MDKQLLLDIFRIPSQSGYEDDMNAFIIDFLRKEAIPYSVDDIGNIYNVNCRNRPLLNAHTDTVQDDTDGKLQKLVKIYNNRFLKGYGVIGADDKCGIYIILQLLKTNEFNFLFTVQEESGLMGSSYFMSKNDISYIPYGLTFDRYGSSDILCTSNDYGNQKFEDALEVVGREFGYRPAMGVLSDADNISDQISTCNLSVGYYGHHTKSEFVDINELENAVNYAQAILDNIQEKFEAPDKRNSYKYYSGYGYYDDDYFTDIEELKELEGHEVCCITGKLSSKLTYINSLKKFISPEGARILYEDLEDSGIIYENDEFDSRFDELEDDFQRAMAGE